MSLLQNQQGMQADCLQARRIEQSQIQTGPHLLLQYCVTQAYPLSEALEAGGRHRVNDVLLLKGAIDSRRLKKDTVGVSGLIGVEGGIPSPFFQKLCGAAVELYDFRVVRRHKRGQQLWEQRVARPLIKGKKSQLPCLLTEQQFV